MRYVRAFGLALCLILLALPAHAAVVDVYFDAIDETYDHSTGLWQYNVSVTVLEPVQIGSLAIGVNEHFTNFQGIGDPPIGVDGGIYPVPGFDAFVLLIVAPVQNGVLVPGPTSEPFQLGTVTGYQQFGQAFVSGTEFDEALGAFDPFGTPIIDVAVHVSIRDPFPPPVDGPEPGTGALLALTAGAVVLARAARRVTAP